jgi:hypothetical protein
MGQSCVSLDEVLAVIRDEYVLRVYEDGLPDGEGSWEAFLANPADWSQSSPPRHWAAAGRLRPRGRALAASPQACRFERSCPPAGESPDVPDRGRLFGVGRCAST